MFSIDDNIVSLYQQCTVMYIQITYSNTAHNSLFICHCIWALPGESSKVVSLVYGCGIIPVLGYGYQTFLTFQMSNIIVLTRQRRTNCCVKEKRRRKHSWHYPFLLLCPRFPPGLSKCHLCIELGSVKGIKKLQVVIWLGFFALQKQIASMLSWKILVLLFT